MTEEQKKKYQEQLRQSLNMSLDVAEAEKAKEFEQMSLLNEQDKLKDQAIRQQVMGNAAGPLPEKAARLQSAQLALGAGRTAAALAAKEATKEATKEVTKEATKEATKEGAKSAASTAASTAVGVAGAGLTAAEMATTKGTGNTATDAGMGALQGATAGAAFGPWGAAAGGVIGGAVGLLKADAAQEQRKRDAEAKKLMQLAEIENDKANRIASSLQAMGNLMAQNMQVQTIRL